MRHSDDDYLRRRPDQQYGGNDQGYSDIPAQERNRRQRNLTAGRYGNTAERLPRDQVHGAYPGDEGRYGREFGERRWPGGLRNPEADARYEDEWSRRRAGARRYGGWEDGRDEAGRYGPGEEDASRLRWQGRPGPGPKNYRRADERIHDEVCSRLAHEHELDVSEVLVHVQEGVVTLEGHVGDRRSKYDIEDIAERVFGVQDVINHIRVQRYGMLASE